MNYERKVKSDIQEWLTKEYGDKFIFSPDLEYKRTIHYQTLKTPYYEVVLNYVSPSTKTDSAKVFWNYHVDFADWNSLNTFLTKFGNGVYNLSTHIDILRDMVLVLKKEIK